MPLNEKGLRVNRLSDEKRSEILASYIRTGNQKRTADECGCSTSTVHKLVHENADVIARARREKTTKIVEAVVQDDTEHLSRDLINMRAIARRSASLHLDLYKEIEDLTAQLAAMDPDDKKLAKERAKLRTALEAKKKEYRQRVPLREMREVDAHIHNMMNAGAPTMAEWVRIYNGVIELIERCPHEGAKEYFSEGFTGIIREIGLQREGRQEEA